MAQPKVRGVEAMSLTSIRVVTLLSALSTAFFLMGALAESDWWRWLGFACSAGVTGSWVLNHGRARRKGEPRSQQ